MSPPIFLKLEESEKLYLYLVVLAHTDNSILITIAEGIQKPIYYVSKALEDAETKYSDIEKLALALFA